MNSKLVNILFKNTTYYNDSNSFGHFVLDTTIMNSINIPRIIDKKIAVNELKIIKRIFDKFRITFFLTHGSCLGAIREKDFIDYDSDIDIGCYKMDLDKIILAIQELKEKYKFKITKLSIDDESISMIKDNVIIDINLYKSDDNNWQSNKNKIFTIPNNFFAKLDKIVFLDLNISIPSNVNKYLEYQYGIDWETPIVDFYNPYKQKIELPIEKIMKNLIGRKLALIIAKNISYLIKKIRNS